MALLEQAHRLRHQRSLELQDKLNPQWRQTHPLYRPDNQEEPPPGPVRLMQPTPEPVALMSRARLAQAASPEPPARRPDLEIAQRLGLPPQLLSSLSSES